MGHTSGPGLTLDWPLIGFGLVWLGLAFFAELLGSACVGSGGHGGPEERTEVRGSMGGGGDGRGADASRPAPPCVAGAQLRGASRRGLRGAAARTVEYCNTGILRRMQEFYNTVTVPVPY